MIKGKDKKKGLNKQAIVEEYLSGEESFKSLGERYGLSGRTIQSWVRSHRKGQNNPTGDSSREKSLQDEIDRLKLKNELLEEIIKLSKKQTGLDLRKKFGPKQ